MLERHASRHDDLINEIHQRWVARRNRGGPGADYRDERYDQQCGSCRFWFPLAGQMGLDYGVCANVRSPFDARVRFEHDGCEEFDDAGAWVVPEDM